MSARNYFDQTGWSTVGQANSEDSQIRQGARERLLQRYRRPIILEIRDRARCSEQEAEELAHEFLHSALKRDFLAEVDPSRGRFRAFIKACISNFLKDHWDKENAAKRGDGNKPDSLDATSEDNERLLDPPDPAVPPSGAALDRAWAREILELSLGQLEEECAAARRAPLFHALKPWLHGDPEEGGYDSAATRLGMNAGALRTAATRMRQRLGEIIEDEIKATVSSGADWREELRYFLELLGKPA